MLIAPKRLKTQASNLAGMLPWNVPTEFLKNYFQKWAWPSSRDPVNCMVLSARPNSYKMVEAIQYTDLRFVSQGQGRDPDI